MYSVTHGLVLVFTKIKLFKENSLTTLPLRPGGAPTPNYQINDMQFSTVRAY